MEISQLKRNRQEAVKRINKVITDTEHLNKMLHYNNEMLTPKEDNMSYNSTKGIKNGAEVTIVGQQDITKQVMEKGSPEEAERESVKVYSSCQSIQAQQVVVANESEEVLIFVVNRVEPNQRSGSSETLVKTGLEAGDQKYGQLTIEQIQNIPNGG